MYRQKSVAKRLNKEQLIVDMAHRGRRETEETEQRNSRLAMGTNGPAERAEETEEQRNSRLKIMAHRTGEDKGTKSGRRNSH
ncbi:hypothetical protein AVEN_91897-1 [Araneus ventricosus]|uniref:Uncharacterized protein n=1 Tax=Araneus ventricosus TaxID=182803 RepID=A0A4Y2LTF4_ARAVE|nr:hypothetical protein AVEN_91897-1 [Araneus ventricosus]